MSDAAAEIKVGDTAPDFTLPRNGSGEVTLSSLSDKTVVLYFYPKDDTSGCTVQAIDFSALGAQFEAANTVVIGISPDDQARLFTPFFRSDRSRDRHTGGAGLGLAIAKQFTGLLGVGAQRMDAGDVIAAAHPFGPGGQVPQSLHQGPARAEIV